MKEKPEAVLLIVDDERSVCRALSRLLDRKVQEILSATNAMEAEVILKSGRVTHVICDHWFGPGQPLGTDLVTEWKMRYPNIRKAVVLTGTDINKLDADAVDAILPKVVDPADLIKVLGFEEDDDEDNENSDDENAKDDVSSE